MRSLISSFQAHVTQTATPAKTPNAPSASQGSLAERALLDDCPVRPDEPYVGKSEQQRAVGETTSDKKNSGPSSEDEKQGQTRNGDRKDRGATQKWHLRSKPFISRRHRQEINREEGSSASTDLNSKVSSRCDFDEVSDDVNDFAIPLHSSSPKRVDTASSDAVSERSQTFDRPLSLSSSSIHSDHSDVTSLLMDRSTSTVDTVISRDILNAARYWKPKSSALSVSSNQSTSNEMSGLAPLPNGKSRYLPLSENEGRRNLDSESARRKYEPQKRGDFISRKESDRILTAGDMLVAIFSLNMWRSIKAYLDPFILNLDLSMFARRSDATLLFMKEQTMAGTNRCKITWFTYHMAHISMLVIRE